MKARPLTKAVADALAQLVLERARDHQRISRSQLGVGEVVYMRAACEDIAAMLLGAVCGTDAELELRRILGDGRRTVASFGAQLRGEADRSAAGAKRARAMQRFRTANAPRVPRRHIDHTHPQD